MNIDTLKSLLWWLFIGVFFFWMMRRGGCGMMAHGHGGRSQSPDDGDGRRFRSASGRPVDPVCGMEIEPAKAAGTRLVMGQTLFFCSPMCLEAFDKQPMAYAHDPRPASRHQHAGC
jgi:YHS domain-containing protein